MWSGGLIRCSKRNRKDGPRREAAVAIRVKTGRIAELSRFGQLGSATTVRRSPVHRRHWRMGGLVWIACSWQLLCEGECYAYPP